MPIKRVMCLVGLSVALLGCDSGPELSPSPAMDTTPGADSATTADVASSHPDAGDVIEPSDLEGPDTEELDTEELDTEELDSEAPPDVAAPDILGPREEITDDVADPADAPVQETSPFGEVVGPCLMVLDPLDETPAVVINTFAFDGDPFAAADLSDDAKVLFDQPNAGGSSKCSEVFSVEVMRLCAGADLDKTETEIDYVQPGPLTDYTITVGVERVGVSVTRAYKGPVIDVYSTEDATTLLEKKLAAVNESTDNVVAEDAWVRQVLHVWTLHPQWAETVADAWQALSPVLKADTLVLITVETGSNFVVSDSCDD